MKRRKGILKEAEEQYRRVVETGPDGVGILGGDYRFKYVNEKLAEIHGYRREELIGKDLRDYLDEESKRMLADRDDQLKRGIESPRFELNILRKDGEVRNAEISAKAIRDPKEDINIIVFVRDTTEHRRGEEITREGEETARRLSQENATMAEIGRIISSTLSIEDVYERFAEEVQKLIPFDRIVINTINIEEATVQNVYMAGKGIVGRQVGEVYPLEGSGNAEMVRRKSTILIQTEDFSEYRDHFPMLLSTFQAGFRSIMNVPLFSKGQLIGGLLMRSFKAYAYTDKDVRLAERVSSQIAGAIANAQLFMERMRAEEALKKSEEGLRESNEELRATDEELRATNEELQAANEELKETQEQLIRSEKLAAIGKLAGGVGHELRNPLGAIKNAAYYIKGKVTNSELAKTEPRVIEFLEIMDEEINVSNKIISDLLNFSRVAKPTVSPAKIRRVMEDALSRLTLPENIEVINKVDANLPEVEIDADQIRQVLLNIATNAMQAMPEGGKLTIDAKKGDRFLEVAISDTGDGISGDVIGKIFDPLFTTRAKGIGLGLAVCKSIIERHGGTIGVESKVGEGATFTIKLPMKSN